MNTIESILVTAFLILLGILIVDVALFVRGKRTGKVSGTAYNIVRTYAEDSQTPVTLFELHTRTRTYLVGVYGHPENIQPECKITGWLNDARDVFTKTLELLSAGDDRNLPVRYRSHLEYILLSSYGLEPSKTRKEPVRIPVE